MKTRKWLLGLSAALALTGCERVRDEEPVAGIEIRHATEPKVVKAEEAKAVPAEQAKAVKATEAKAAKAGQAEAVLLDKPAGLRDGIRIGEAAAFEAELPVPAPGSANKVINERPPLTETAYRAKFKEFPPRGLLIVAPERRYYRYASGERLHWDEFRQLWLPGDPKSAAPE